MLNSAGRPPDLGSHRSCTPKSYPQFPNSNTLLLQPPPPPPTKPPPSYIIPPTPSPPKSPCPPPPPSFLPNLIPHPQTILINYLFPPSSIPPSSYHFTLNSPQLTPSNPLINFNINPYTPTHLRHPPHLSFSHPPNYSPNINFLSPTLLTLSPTPTNKPTNFHTLLIKQLLFSPHLSIFLNSFSPLPLSILI